MNKNFLHMLRYKEDIITFLLVVITFLLFVFTPGKETLGSAVQGFILALIFFGFLPLGYHFFVLRKKREDFGFGKEVWNKGTWLIAPAVLIALSLSSLIFFLFPAFQEAVMLPSAIQESFPLFVTYELLLVPMLALLYEIFFRGLIQKIWLQKHWSYWAIFAQSGIFILFLLMTGSLGWNALPFILFSFFSGFLVWKNNALLQAWVASWLYLFFFDIFVLIMR